MYIILNQNSVMSTIIHWNIRPMLFSRFHYLWFQYWYPTGMVLKDHLFSSQSSSLLMNLRKQKIAWILQSMWDNRVEFCAQGLSASLRHLLRSETENIGSLSLFLSFSPSFISYTCHLSLPSRKDPESNLTQQNKTKQKKASQL